MKPLPVCFVSAADYERYFTKPLRLVVSNDEPKTCIYCGRPIEDDTRSDYCHSICEIEARR